MATGDWAEACLRIIEAGAEGADRVFELLVGAARRLSGAEGASVVSWQPGGPRHLAMSGAQPRLPERRLGEGRTVERDRTVVSLGVQGDIDLVVWWPARGSAPDQLDELRLLASLAATAARPAAGALSSLYAVARRLLASRDMEEVLLGLATATADVLRAEIAGVFLATPDGAAVEAKAVVGHRSMGTARLRVATGESLIGHVFATGEVYRADDWRTDPVTSKALLPIASVEGTQSAIGAPMRVDGKTVGVLAAWRRRRSIYTDDDAALIATLADLAALGVQRAQADEKLRELSEQLMAANSELSRRYTETSQALEIHRRLMRVVADGADLAAVLAALSGITGQEITFVGSDGAVVGPRGWLEALVQTHGIPAPGESRRTELGEEAVLLGPDDAGRHAIAVAVRSAGRHWGVLAVATKLPTETRDVVAAEQAAVACAVLLSSQDAVAGAARRLESEFVWDLLEGRIVDEGDALVRSRQLARVLPVPARIVLLSAGPPGHGSGDWPRAAAESPQRVEQLGAELSRRAAQVLAAHGVHAPVGRRGETLALIVPNRPLAEVRRIGSALCQLADPAERGLTVGISAPVHAIGQYPVAARQAGYARAATRAPGRRGGRVRGPRRGAVPAGAGARRRPRPVRRAAAWRSAGLRPGPRRGPGEHAAGLPGARRARTACRAGVVHPPEDDELPVGPDRDAVRHDRRVPGAPLQRPARPEDPGDPQRRRLTDTT